MELHTAKLGPGHPFKESVNGPARNSMAFEFRRSAGCLLVCLLAAFFTPKAHAAADKKGQVEILIAREQVDDPYFHHSVVVMLPEDTTDLVVGLIINKPTRLTLGKLFPDSPELKARTEPAYFGGPVDVSTPSVVFRSQKEPDNAVRLYGDVYLTFDSDQISGAFQTTKAGSGARLFLGRAQWSPGQLENEIRLGGWYRIKAEGDLIFSSEPDKLWRTLHDRAAPSKYIRYRPPSGNSQQSSRKATVM
ncbi:MAG TPA: YqgE/AlgH family protein [Terriglobia bacterium]|nr:YqgE/AlgH family protein [Terriglobia bacterium]